MSPEDAGVGVCFGAINGGAVGWTAGEPAVVATGETEVGAAGAVAAAVTTGEATVGATGEAAGPVVATPSAWLIPSSDCWMVSKPNSVKNDAVAALPVSS